MTTRIEIALDSNNNGTWLDEVGLVIAEGLRYDPSGGQMEFANQLAPHVLTFMEEQHQDSIDDALVYAVDQNGDDICQFRIIDGFIEAQV